MFGRGSWRLFVLGALLLALPFGAAFWLTASEQQRIYNNELQSLLVSQTRLVGNALRDSWPELPVDEIAALTHTLWADGYEVAIVVPGLDSVLAPRNPRLNQRLREDEIVQQALLTGSAAATRRFDGARHAVAAIRIGSDDDQLGVIVLARPLFQISGRPEVMSRLLAIVAAVAALTTFLLVLAWLRFRRRLVRRLVRGARNLSIGNLSAKVEVSGSDELAMLAASLNVIRRRLATQVKTIEEQRAMLDALVHQLREGVIVIRDDARVLLMNPAAARLLSLKGRPEDFVGKPIAGVVSERTLEELMEPVPDDADTRDTAPRQAKVELESEDGVRTLRAHASQLTLAAEDGHSERTTGRLVVLTDITELQRTIQMRTDFVANASHELRTPLSTIRVATEALLAMDFEDSEVENFVRIIERHSGRLENLVSDLLDLSRLESLESRFEPETVRVSELLDGLYSRFEEPLGRGGLNWEQHCDPPNVVTVEINQHLARLVLDNMVDNAIKHTESGGLISVNLERRDGTLRMAVRDTGCGIPEGERKRVFERFYQVARDRTGGKPGTGLGLSIIRHAVSAMRGEVYLESEVGVGTEVGFRIPQPRNASDEPRTSSAQVGR